MPALNINRQEVGRIVTESFNKDFMYNISYPTSTSITSGVYQNLYEVRTTTNTPGYSNPARKGWLPARSFLFEKRDYRYSKGESLGYYLGGGRQVTVVESSGPGVGWCGSLSKFVATDNAVPPSPPSQVPTAHLERVARARVLSDIKDMKVNIAQVVAERQQTIDLFLHTAKRVAGALAAIKRGSFLEAAKQLGIPSKTRRQRARITRKRPRSRPGEFEPSQVAANEWLALQYGWKPLLSDVFGSAEALAQFFNQRAYGRAHGRAKIKLDNFRLETVDTPTSEHLLSDYPATNWRRTLPAGHRRHETTVSGKSEVSYSISFAAPTQAHWPSALGLTNPLLIAWELLPFSFVADWFVNVGDTLSNLDATVGLEFIDGSRTTFHSYEWRSEGFRDGKDGSYYYIYDGHVRSFKWVYCRREVLQSFPYAPPPFVKDHPFSPTHIANAVALIVSNFKK